MIGLKGMVVGGFYLAGDGLGYDKVQCLEINPKETPMGCYGVKIKYLDSGNEDIWCENPQYGFSIYVEPYNP